MIPRSLKPLKAKEASSLPRLQPIQDVPGTSRGRVSPVRTPSRGRPAIPAANEQVDPGDCEHAGNEYSGHHPHHQRNHLEKAFPVSSVLAGLPAPNCFMAAVMTSRRSCSIRWTICPLVWINVNERKTSRYPDYQKAGKPHNLFRRPPAPETVPDHCAHSDQPEQVRNSLGQAQQKSITPPSAAEQPGTIQALAPPRLTIATAAGAGVSTEKKNPASGTNRIERKRPTDSTISIKSSFVSRPRRWTGKSSLVSFISCSDSPTKAYE